MTSKKPNKKKNKVRIIAGQWRGSLIDFPDASDLRPTSDRVKETVFNWLAPYLVNSCALDLFAGSGALGFEALSRGAKEVHFIEQNYVAANHIKKNLEKFHAEHALVINQDAFDFIKTNSLQNYDLIFLDPPYKLIEPLALIHMLDKKLSQEKICRLFYEHHSNINEQELPENWHLSKQKKAGQVFFNLLTHSP